MSNAAESRHLSVLPGQKQINGRLTRGQVANRLGLSVSTVRRFEGTRLHPTIDADDVRWFDEGAVASLAVELANAYSVKRKTSPAIAPSGHAERSPGELAALVFERFEQRQSLAEIVIGLRITPELVRGLFDQWTLGLTEGQLRLNREPSVSRATDFQRVKPDVLAARLAELPDGQLTRISVARSRERYTHGEHEYARLDELGGFSVSGPITNADIIRRYGVGAFRISAFGFQPNGLRWEVLVEALSDGG